MIKKILIITLILFPAIVLAGGKNDDGVKVSTMVRATCVYRNTSTRINLGQPQTTYNYAEFDFAGIDTTVSGPSIGIKTYFNVDLGEFVNTFETEYDGIDYIINYNRDFGVKFTVSDYVTNKFRDNSKDEQTLQKAIDNGEFCPSTVYKVYTSNKPLYMFCNGVNKDLGVDTCAAAKNYLKEDYSVIEEFKVYYKTAISNNGQSDSTKTDVKDKYVEVKLEEKDLCDPTHEKYDAEKCKVVGNISETVTEQADDQGIEEEELEEYFEYKKVNLETKPQKVENCQSLFGDPKVKDPATPAYYMSVAFSVMRYAAIILLLVLTTMDFVSAVASQDNDILKKTVNKTMKRAMLCVIIFFLPTIINFVLQIIHTSQISDCIDFNV